MRIDTEALRRNYASLTDQALAEIDPDELVEAAREVYDEEVARRGKTVSVKPAAAPAPTHAPPANGLEEASDDGAPPDWLEDAECACSFHIPRGTDYSDAAVDACTVLEAAGIPSHLATDEGDRDRTEPRRLANVMVPRALLLHATSVLDRDIFNQEQEDAWRAQLEMLSDADLRALDPEILCAGILDRAARLRQAYEDELARRGTD